MNKTFIIGVDNNLEDLLPWCVTNIKKHNPDIHITIADFGCTPSTQAWIKEHAHEVLTYTKHNKSAWFYKPQTLLDSRYQYKCWIDIDCEICGDLSGIFEYCNETSIGLTEDPCRRDDKTNGSWLATGVVVVKDKPPLLQIWAEKCLNSSLRGDQEIFRDILVKNPIYKNKIIIMPMIYQWLRLMKTDNPDKRIMHWTGPKGKMHIRKNLINKK